MNMQTKTIVSAAAVVAAMFGASEALWGQTPSADSADLVQRGAEVYSRECQRCHVPRSPSEFGDREWVIIVQHMQTRANLTRAKARAALAFLLASNQAARRPGTERTGLPMPVSGDITAAMIDAGRDVFHGRGGCAACHGQGLGGGPIAPNLRDAQWKNGDGSFQAILGIVRNGVEGTAMAAYPAGISDQDAVQVAAYVWAVALGRTEP